MSTTATIFGLSHAGFRVPKSGGGFARVKKDTSVVIDVDDHVTQNLIYGERDNFIFTRPSATFTVTNATPAVFSATAHGLVAGDKIKLTTTGAFPTGLVAGNTYYVISTGLAADSFRVSTTYGGSAVNTTHASESGTHTFQHVSANIVGLSHYGFRVKVSDGTYKKCKIGTVLQVDLTDGRVVRNLRRNWGQFIVSTSATAFTLRGILPQLRGFDLEAKETVTLTGSNAGNATNGKIVTIGTQVYTIKTNLTEVKATDTVSTSGTPASTRASGTITSSATGAPNGATVTIGGTTYTFVTALTNAGNTPNEIIRDGTIDHELNNLKAAIEGGAGSGTLYGVGTAVRTDITISAPSTHVSTVTAVSYNATIGNAIVLTKTGGAGLAVSGSGVLASGANETVTVNGRTYTFVEALTTAGTGGVTVNEVLINGQDTSVDNLVLAINAGAGAGTVYATGTTVNADVAAGARVSHTTTLTAKSTVAATGNALTLAVVGAHLARGAALFTGGIDPVANEVHISGVNADGTLTNLSEAINAGAGVGTDYSTGTTANAIVTASAVNSHVITLTEKSPGVIPFTTTTNEATYSFGAVTGGIPKVYRLHQTTVDPSVTFNYRNLRRQFKGFVPIL